MNSIKDEVLAHASELGIDLAGVTVAEPFDRLLSELNDRLPHYQERYAYRIDTWRRFADPRKTMPEARAVLVLGFYYLTDESPPAGVCGRLGRVVSYGHLGILKRTRAMVKFLQRRGYRAVMGAHRKEAALRAGLGMIGKNNLVINRRFGTWVAYQSIVTDAPLEPDAPCADDPCGDCTECLGACPTRALYEPRRIDPRRCIAYLLTSKTMNPEDWPRIGDSILACDRCQEACPHNRGLTPKRGIDSFFPPGIGIHPPLRHLLQLDEDAFQDQIIAHAQDQLIGDTTLGRLLALRPVRAVSRFVMKTFFKGKEKLPETLVHASGNLLVYQRNAILAAGNLKARELAGDVGRFADDPYLGPYARWALEQMK